MKIALALSGGGYRATVFHLGVLARLAEDRRIEEVNFLSTVSGGSLCAGLVLAQNGYHWPTSAEYFDKVLPSSYRLLTTLDFQIELIWRVVGSIGDLFDTRADNLSDLIRRGWGVDVPLSALPENPRWLINATCYETGKNWRFERFRMGDYMFGYSYDTQGVALSDAMAASAGFPGLIGALSLDASRFRWFRYTGRDEEDQPLMDIARQRRRKTQPIQELMFPEVHLWDGGVYDNHGLEGLHDFRTGWRKGIEFLIVSDAAGRSRPEAYEAGPKALFRIMTGIMMDQIRSLRARAIVERLQNHKDQGVFLVNGNSCREVIGQSKLSAEASDLSLVCLDDTQVAKSANFPTIIRKLSDEEFLLLFRHGFEVADYTLYAFHPDRFQFIGYANSRSALTLLG
jgi:NTE family protein